MSQGVLCSATRSGIIRHMARLTVSPALRNRNSVLSTARAQFTAGQNPSLDSVVVAVFDPQTEAYESAIVTEFENFGSFGGQY